MARMGGNSLIHSYYVYTFLSICLLVTFACMHAEYVYYSIVHNNNCKQHILSLSEWLFRLWNVTQKSRRNKGELYVLWTDLQGPLLGENSKLRTPTGTHTYTYAHTKYYIFSINTYMYCM